FFFFFFFFFLCFFFFFFYFIFFFFFFFFFQAEDGIRDRDVTGVQTCALPISRGTLGRWTRPWSGRLGSWRLCDEARSGLRDRPGRHVLPVPRRTGPLRLLGQYPGEPGPDARGPRRAVAARGVLRSRLARQRPRGLPAWRLPGHADPFRPGRVRDHAAGGRGG